MTKDKTFIVRIDGNELKEFNRILKKNSINRSELLRTWIKDYINEEMQQNEK